MHLALALSFLLPLQAPNYCCRIILLFRIYDTDTFQSSSLQCFDVVSMPMVTSFVTVHRLKGCKVLWRCPGCQGLYSHVSLSGPGIQSQLRQGRCVLGEEWEMWTPVVDYYICFTYPTLRPLTTFHKPPNTSPYENPSLDPIGCQPLGLLAPRPPPTQSISTRKCLWGKSWLLPSEDKCMTERT